MTTKLGRQVHRMARKASRSQWCLRGIVVLAPLVTLLAGALAGAQLHWLLVVLVLAGGLTAAGQPDSHATGATSFLLVVFWWWSVPSASGVPVLLAAAALVALHVAGTVAAYGPATVEDGTDLVRLWVRRGLLLWVVAFAAWATGRLASPAELPVVLGLVLVAAVVWWAAVRFAAATAPGGS